MNTRPLPRLALSFALCAAALALPALGHAQGAVEPDLEADAALHSWNFPAVLVAGQPFGAHFEYENRSDFEWTAEGGVSMLPLGDSAGEWDLTSIELRPGEVVEPGVHRSFTFTARAPETPGTYSWRWELQQEGAPIEQIPPVIDVEVIARDDEADYEPLFFREHRGDVEVHENSPLALRTEDGQPMFLMGKSAYGLLARRGSGPFMEESAAQGFNMVRVYLLAPDLAACLPIACLLGACRLIATLLAACRLIATLLVACRLIATLLTACGRPANFHCWRLIGSFATNSVTQLRLAADGSFWRRWQSQKRDGNLTAIYA